MSRPSRKSRLSSCAGRTKPACRAVSHCSTPAMATTRRCVTGSQRWKCLTRCISATTTVWAPATAPLPAKQRRSGRGRPAKRLRRDRKHRPLSVKALALRQPNLAWQTITWRQGTAAPLSSRFARLRVRPAHRDEKLTEPRPEEWLLIEWPEGEKEPTKYWLSTLPEDIEFAVLVDIAKLRWRIERDYQELKQEVGLGHFEGRGWRGFHHHATMCIATYGFLVS